MVICDDTKRDIIDFATSRGCSAVDLDRCLDMVDIAGLLPNDVVLRRYRDTEIDCYRIACEYVLLKRMASVRGFADYVKVLGYC